MGFTISAWELIWIILLTASVVALVCLLAFALGAYVVFRTKTVDQDAPLFRSLTGDKGDKKARSYMDGAVGFGPESGGEGDDDPMFAENSAAAADAFRKAFSSIGGSQ